MPVVGVGGHGLNGVLTEIVSLVAGVLTGFFFERRATNDARRYNEDLQRQVSVLKTSVFSLGGKSGEAAEDSPPSRDLAGLVTERAIATQDPAGRVNRRALIAHFLEREHAARDIEAAISSLCDTGIAHEDGQWLQMT
jgi:uncharacterized protein YneF (UPF0154 family)